MSIETTVLDFKLSNTFEEYEAHMNAPKQQAMFKGVATTGCLIASVDDFKNGTLEIFK